MKNIDKSFLGHPKPLFSLSMTELWERFSFYGIRPLLVLFMAASISVGGLNISKEEAAAIAGIFGGCLYLAALPGGWLADNYLGQKKAIFIGSIIIALGHLSIALSIFNSTMFFVGLAFIVIGTGLFKTCASVVVGMLYSQEDPRRDSGFTIFYMGINLGAFIAPLICGFLQVKYGWHIGFGAGGIGMLIALLIFYFKTIPDLVDFDKNVGIKYSWDKPIKYNKNVLWFAIVAVVILIALSFFIFIGFIKLNPITIAKNMVFIILFYAGIYFLYLFFFSSLNNDEKKKLLVFIILFFSAAVFWSVFEQQYTSFNFFADTLTNRNFLGFEIPTVWFQSINALFIIAFAPIVAFVWTILAKMKFEISSISKFTLGLIGAALGFFVMVLASKSVISSNDLASPLWLVLSFFFLTLGELCLSPVGLSLMTKIAPNLIKAQVMGLWFVSLSLGNIIAGLIGGEASKDNANALVDLFSQCIWILLAMAFILFIFKNKINKMISH
ncbi:peptide MFS transporter [Campylobacter insulaenigrae]|uniref:peptide MFS transporter n=1 Tax=Campylobacter insulaenigrae TaxID=260714 RepID=UPI002152FF45|nr:peptide MFS transporter [Campylobacter insulaenigrae]MCR6582800.1 peptide MFS transporter [Campylobacter insulaenigrae]